jgi:hypothetical protein
VRIRVTPLPAGRGAFSAPAGAERRQPEWIGNRTRPRSIDRSARVGSKEQRTSVAWFHGNSAGEICRHETAVNSTQGADENVGDTRCRVSCDGDDVATLHHVVVAEIRTDKALAAAAWLLNSGRQGRSRSRRQRNSMRTRPAPLLIARNDPMADASLPPSARGTREWDV